MSLHWYFSAFPAGTFAQVFGSSGSEAIAAFLELIEWEGKEGGGEFDVPTTQDLARRVLTEGLDYRGRSNQVCKLLDQIVASALSPEGAEALGLEALSVGGCDGPDHVWARFANKAKPSAPFKVLPWLERGRRWGTTAQCSDVWGAHLVLAPAEVALLAPELKEVIALRIADPTYVDDLEEFVLPQLAELEGRDIELVGHSVSFR